MTTSVKIHVNGRYKAEVTRNLEVPITVHGNYEGSPNPSGEMVFWLVGGGENNFRISESEVPQGVPGPVLDPPDEELSNEGTTDSKGE